MKTLDKGQDKIKKICDILRNETLEPAQKQAEEIIAAAEKKGEEIVREAERRAHKVIDDAKLNIEHQHNVFESSLQQAAKQAVEALRQAVEKQFFNDELDVLLDGPARDPAIVADLLKSIVKAIEKEGLAVNLTAEIPKSVSSKEMNGLLGEKILKTLANGTTVLGEFNGGVKVRLNNKRMTLDVTKETIKDLLAAYLRKDFRKMIFSS